MAHRHPPLRVRYPPANCAECGAPLPDSGGCGDYVARLVALEAQVLDRGVASRRAHFFAVATYRLQHPSRLTATDLDTLRQRVTQTLREPDRIPDDVAADTRPRDRSDVDPSWPTRWPMTVHDVVTRPASEYIRVVIEWAATTMCASPAH